MIEITQETVDALKTEALLLAPSGKAAETEADTKAKAHLPLEAQARFLRKVIDAFESADLAKYLPAPPKTTSDGSRKRPDKTNPWSAEGRNTTKQGALVRSIGEAKATAIAEAAGCKRGSTRPNPSYN